MPAATSKIQFACSSCGAGMQFNPETGRLKCPSCGNTQAPIAGSSVTPHDFTIALSGQTHQPISSAALQVTCSGCGGTVAFVPPEVAGNCSFCGAPIVAQPKAADPLIAPDAVLPALLPKQKAIAQLQQWLSSLWFAPNALKRLAQPDGINGVYLPFWTYYFHTESDYTGARGEYYYETEEYTETDSNGQSVQRTRQVQRTNWYPASGHVSEDFSSVLVPATKTVPEERLNKLEPWDLQSLSAYEPAYLAGFRAQRYQVELAEGLDHAKSMIANEIESQVRRDIGGDVQNVTSINTLYSNIAFLHLLLPVWIGVYRFQGQLFHIAINARTGEVQGERPYSPWKIALLVAAILTALLLVAVFHHG